MADKKIDLKLKPNPFPVDDLPDEDQTPLDNGPVDLNKLMPNPFDSYKEAEPQKTPPAKPSPAKTPAKKSIKKKG